MLHLHDPYGVRIREALTRDERDMARLTMCSDAIGRAMDLLLPRLENLEHPDARWHPIDLVQALTEQAENICYQREMIARQPVVLDRRDDDEAA